MGENRYLGQDTRLFRFIVLISLILIFITVATLKIWELRIAAERVGVMHALGALKSTLGIHLSGTVVHDGVQALAPLHHSNPIHLLLQQDGEVAPHTLSAGIAPQNYLGEFHSAETPQEGGVWYFDLDQKVLVYRVNFTDHFISSNREYPHSARYQLRVRYTDLNGNGLFEPKLDRATGIGIEPMDHYTWLLDKPEQPHNAETQQ